MNIDYEKIQFKALLKEFSKIDFNEFMDEDDLITKYPSKEEFNEFFEWYDEENPNVSPIYRFLEKKFTILEDDRKMFVKNAAKTFFYWTNEYTNEKLQEAWYEGALQSITEYEDDEDRGLKFFLEAAYRPIAEKLGLRIEFIDWVAVSKENTSIAKQALKYFKKYLSREQVVRFSIEDKYVKARIEKLFSTENINN